tara:strand:- start:4260 stop:4511 length:252 start_codon:yes stop_codon:yes gene_type:complete
MLVSCERFDCSLFQLKFILNYFVFYFCSGLVGQHIHFVGVEAFTKNSGPTLEHPYLPDLNLLDLEDSLYFVQLFKQVKLEQLN